MTIETEPVALQTLLDLRHSVVSEATAAVDKTLAEEGPLSLGFHLQSIKRDVEALLDRLEVLQMALEASGIDGDQVDLGGLS